MFVLNFGQRSESEKSNLTDVYVEPVASFSLIFQLVLRPLQTYSISEVCSLNRQTYLENMAMAADTAVKTTFHCLVQF